MTNGVRHRNLLTYGMASSGLDSATACAHMGNSSMNGRTDRADHLFTSLTAGFTGGG
jgi:hypothetical protein